MSGRDPLPREQAYEGVRAVNPPDIIRAKRAPNTNDFKYPFGTIWINTVSGISYQLINDPGIWAVLGVAGGGAVNVIGDSLGFQAVPVGGQINIVGGTNITTNAVGNDIDVSTIANPVFGSVTSTNDITTTTGDVIISAANSTVELAGHGSYLSIRSGTVLDFVNVAILVAGTVTVPNTNIIANDTIFLQVATPGGTRGDLSYSIIPGVSFTILSTSNVETSTVAYFIVRRIP